MIVGFVQTWDFAWKLMVIFDREHDDQWVTLFSNQGSPVECEDSFGD
jgi:hypothetical protein